MKAKHTDLEKLEQLYKESGNQLVVLYGRRGCQKEEIIVAQSENRRSIIGFCNWDKPMMTMDMCENMAMAMEQARLTSDDYYLFSATDFEPALQSYVVRDPRFKLINMNEL